VCGGPAVVYENPVQFEAAAVAGAGALVGATLVVAVDVVAGEVALGQVHCTDVHPSQDADGDGVCG